MNRYLKQELKKAFAFPIPDPQEKARFLRTLPQPQITIWRFLLTQAAYLRKRTLFLSALFLLPALTSVRELDPNALWTIAALIPFLGLLAVTESTRSAVYGMQEFEMSTRFSLKSVMLARMSIFGLLDAGVICCLIPILAANSKITLLQTGVYLLVPYLLTVNGSLWLTRRLQEREALYGSLCAAALVSTLSFVLRLLADFIYQFSYIHWWLLLTLFLLGKAAGEITRAIKQTEELLWN